MKVKKVQQKVECLKNFQKGFKYKNKIDKFNFKYNTYYLAKNIKINKINK